MRSVVGRPKGKGGGRSSFLFHSSISYSSISTVPARPKYLAPDQAPHRIHTPLLESRRPATLLPTIAHADSRLPSLTSFCIQLLPIAKSKNSKNTEIEREKESLRRSRKQGIFFFFAKGKPYQSFHRAVKGMSMVSPEFGVGAFEGGIAVGFWLFDAEGYRAGRISRVALRRTHPQIVGRD